MKLNLTIPVPTSINELYINQYKFNPKTKKSEPTGARILSAKGKTTKRIIQKAARNQMKSQTWSYDFTKSGFVYIDLTFYFSRMGRDADNCLKLLQDSLQGIVFDNDSRVLCRVQRILYDTADPRVELEIRPVSYIGVFDSQQQLDEFESVCKGCSRYGNNCSILAKAKEGRIQEEIQDMKCSKYKEKKK